LQERIVPEAGERIGASRRFGEGPVSVSTGSWSPVGFD
jgi:hypothetical protein